MQVNIFRLMLVSVFCSLVIFTTVAETSNENKPPKKKSLAHRARKRKADFIEKNIPNYLNMQIALFNDSLEPVISIAKTLNESLNQEEISDIDLKTSLEKLSNVKNLKEARAEFKNLSVHFVQWVQNNFINDVEILFCPSTNSKWIQRKGEVNNPIDEGDLKKCGEKEK